ncbi:MAG: hypothetical protein PVF43_08440 [Candidatus Eiseniibacteriota bacterium]|jgi:hypothetical protein
MLLVAIPLLVALVTGRPASAQERPGTLSLGIQGQYGLIAGPSDFAEEYDRGAGFAIRIRYALGGPQAFGISFESQNFDPDASAPLDTGEDDAPVDLKLSNATLEYLRYFNRGEGQSQYLTVGFGLYHPSEERTSGLTALSDGLVLLGGIGTEIFALRTTAFDLSLRANALFGGDAVSASFEAGVGVHHYLIK